MVRETASTIIHENQHEVDQALESAPGLYVGVMQAYLNDFQAALKEAYAEGFKHGYADALDTYKGASEDNRAAVDEAYEAIEDAILTLHGAETALEQIR
jgi:flagellar biosynthesis/type III secretory pathway protein FliH